MRLAVPSPHSWQMRLVLWAITNYCLFLFMMIYYRQLAINVCVLISHERLFFRCFMMWLIKQRIVLTLWQESMSFWTRWLCCPRRVGSHHQNRAAQKRALTGNPVLKLHALIPHRSDTGMPWNFDNWKYSSQKLFFGFGQKFWRAKIIGKNPNSASVRSICEPMVLFIFTNCYSKK